MKILHIGSLPPVRDGVADHNYFLYKDLFRESKNDNYILPSKRQQDYTSVDIPPNKILSYDDLKNMNFDLLHFQIGNSYPSSYVFDIFNLFKNVNVKKVITIHDLTNTNLAKIIRTIRSQPLNLIYELNKPTMKELVENVDKIIVYSDFMRKKIKNTYGNNNKISTFYMGANKIINVPKNVLRKKLGFNKKTFIMTSFGFITPRKGYEEVIKSLNFLNKNGEANFKYFILGRFNFMHYKIYLKYLINKFNLQKKIIFTGYQPIETIEKYLLLSDVIIQPRKNSNEGASASLATALFSGNPIITSDIGSFSEYIKNNATGLLVNHKPGSYQRAINELYKNEKKRKLIGQSALKWANKNLEWNVIAKKHLTIYNNLLVNK